MKYFLFTLLVLGFVSCTKTKKEYYSDGSLKSEIEMRGGKKNGKSVYFYANGKKQMECGYQDDALNGIMTRWAFTGKIEMVSNYKNGLRDGETRLYTSEGVLEIIQHYTMDTLDGLFIEYFPNGVEKIHGQYSKGMYDGLWQYFLSNGLLVGRGEFIGGSGKLESYFYENGKIKGITEYRNNLRDGKDILYKQDGTIEFVRYFNEDRIIEMPAVDSAKTQSK